MMEAKSLVRSRQPYDKPHGAMSIPEHTILDYDNTLCHGVTIDITKSVPHVSTMERTDAQWIWPQKKQEIWYISHEVLRKQRTQT